MLHDNVDNFPHLPKCLRNKFTNHINHNICTTDTNLHALDHRHKLHFSTHLVSLYNSVLLHQYIYQLNQLTTNTSHNLHLIYNLFYPKDIPLVNHNNTLCFLRNPRKIYSSNTMVLCTFSGSLRFEIEQYIQYGGVHMENNYIFPTLPGNMHNLQRR